MPRSMSRSTRMARSRGPRAQTQWNSGLASPFGGQFVLVPAASRVAGTFKPAQMGQTESPTIIRTLGSWYARPDDTVNSRALPYAFGLTIISDEAAGIGPIAIASPADGDGDWLFFRQWYTPANGFANDWTAINPMQIDSKAQRKVIGQNKTLAMVISNRDTADDLRFFFQTRILFRLA